MPGKSVQAGARALLVIGMLAASAAADPSTAPTKQPTQQDLDRAREYFKAAEAARGRHDYKAAADKYLAAYQLFPDPEFFFNVGEVYRLAGDEANALIYYQRYLDLEPSGRGAATARTAVEELRRSLAAKKAETERTANAYARRKADEDARRKASDDARHRASDGSKTVAAEIDATHKADKAKHESSQDTKAAAEINTSGNADNAPRRISEDAAKLATEIDVERKADKAADHRAGEDVHRNANGNARSDATNHNDTAKQDDAKHRDAADRDVDIATQTNATTRSATSTRGRTFRIAGLATGGAGVAGLAIGVGFGIHAKSISDEASHWDMFHQARFDEGRAAQRDMYILTGVGAAALIAGGVLYYLGYQAGTAADQDTGTVAFMPAAIPGKVILTAAGHF